MKCQSESFTLQRKVAHKVELEEKARVLIALGHRRSLTGNERWVEARVDVRTEAVEEHCCCTVKVLILYDFLPTNTYRHTST